MKQLKYFLLGATSVMFLLPILHAFLEVILLWIETFESKPKEKILNHQKNVIILEDFISPVKNMTDNEDD